MHWLGNLRLGHKLGLLAGILMIIELALLVFLASAFLEARRIAEDIQVGHSSVITSMNSIGMLTQVGMALGNYSITRRQKYSDEFDNDVKQLKLYVDELEAKGRESTARAEKVRGIARVFGDTVDDIVRYKESIDSSGEVEWSSLARTIRPKIMRAVKELTNYVGLERQLYSERLHQDELSNQKTVFIALTILFAFNIGVALALFLLFHKDIYRRLEVLTENSMRLAKGAPLKERLTGNDEIANLDAVFHSMAKALADARMELEEALHRVEQLVANMPVGLVSFEQHGEITSLNPRMGEMFGIAANSFSGKNILDLFSAERFSDPADFVQMLMEKAAGRPIELTAKRENGSEFPAEVSINEMTAGGKNLLLANVQDVTARHEIERMKQEFVSMVSHDLRTPLTSIRGTITLVQNQACGPVAEEARQMLEEADSELDRLTKLITDLLDIAKIESGKLHVEIEEAEIRPVVRRSVAAVARLAQSRGIQITDRSKSDVYVLADTERIIQVLVNLLSNAIKFSADGGTIEIETEKVEQLVETRIIDHGRGVPKSQQIAIFERFHQVEKDDAKAKGGTGLGLPICKSIVEQHGGTIGVRSDGQTGSTFYFTLPEAPSDDAQDQPTICTISQNA